MPICGPLFQSDIQTNPRDSKVDQIKHRIFWGLIYKYRQLAMEFNLMLHGGRFHEGDKFGEIPICKKILSDIENLNETDKTQIDEIKNKMLEISKIIDEIQIRTTQQVLSKFIERLKELEPLVRSDK